MFQASNLNKIGKISLLFIKRIFVIFLLFLFTFPAKSQDANKGIKKIVIDPGHGGKDSGTMGTKRYKQYEKHIALAVSLKLGDYIAKSFPDIEIIYTRKTDIFLELQILFHNQPFFLVSNLDYSTNLQYSALRNSSPLD